MSLHRVVVLLIGLWPPSEAGGQATLTPVGGLPESYVLRGTIRDTSTGVPVSEARIWPYLRGWGVISDKEGNYELRWRGPGVETFIVRRCDERNLATVSVDFLRDSVLQRDIAIAGSLNRECTSGDRLPWAVDGRDTTRFTGHYTYSWEGGGRLEACDGTRYSPDWDSALGQKLRQRQKRDGQVSFVRFRGRIAQDHLADKLRPGFVHVNYPGPLFLVHTVEEVRPPRRGDCG